ncbi:MAG: hypothetical protein PF574_09340 [Candidatus Delongbacteria bacterium]|jgi:hypothetical protein|nr:hypothetical protein [Candidatus Delongbacteria bacterium]
MYKNITIVILLILSNAYLLAKSYRPESFVLKNETSKSELTEDRLGGNFILDIIKDPSSDPALDSVIYVATGDGFSKGFNTFGDIDDIEWMNSIVGYGGSSAIAIDKFNNIWMTTATDSFITKDNLNKFLATGTGVHMSADSGKTWSHFPQPGITPVQGLTYDIACDTLGGVWLASFGQSLQKTDDQGENWRTVICGEDSIAPLLYMNQRMFSVHHTDLGKLWVGTAAGINLCVDYSQPDSLLQWKHYTYRSGLSGDFVTSINSNEFSDGKEYIWVTSWLAEDNNEINGVSFTSNDGLSWKTCLLDEKIYNIGFNGDDVFACGESGLWKSSDIGNYWEKYNISVFSEIKNSYINISKVYSFNYQNGKMFIGTGSGLVVSDDEGITWNIVEAYEDANDSSNKTYAYPNPFSPERFNEQKIQFKLTTPETISCKIYNFAMEKVRDVVLSKSFDAGEHYISWDGKDNGGNEIANGVYFYIITYGDKKLWNKIIIFD